MLRTGFGGKPADIESLLPMEWEELVDYVLDTSTNPPATDGAPDVDESRPWGDRYKDMVHFWFNRGATIPKPITEKMVLFWHGFLVSGYSKVGNLHDTFYQHQLFRTHGLGNFTELLQQVSIGPAMLRYLDNRTNRKGSPNENFARELMELFTLGVDEYTEEDVQAAARAWTGHTLVDGEYQFVSNHHDYDDKTFFGTTQNWDGPDIIEHIVNGPKQTTCARFVARKLWTFIGTPSVSQDAVNATADDFISSGMDITALLRSILLHPEFRAESTKQGLIKSPIELMISAMKQTGITSAEIGGHWLPKTMGQTPYNPPNVSGWRPNLYWINNTTVWSRFKFADQVKYRLYNDTELLEGSHELPVEEAVTNALAVFGLTDVSDSSRNAMETYVTAQRQDSWSTGERLGLLKLPLVTPEFWMA